MYFFLSWLFVTVYYNFDFNGILIFNFKSKELFGTLIWSFMTLSGVLTLILGSTALTHLRWRQASGSLCTLGEHGEFGRSAALTLWRRSEVGPLWTLQSFYEGGAHQGHLPLCGDVITREIPAEGRKESQLTNKTKSGEILGERVAHSRGSSAMQRVPKPGLSSKTSPKYLMSGSTGRSLLQKTK